MNKLAGEIENTKMVLDFLLQNINLITIVLLVSQQKPHGLLQQESH
jgi:hypothetical protein